MVADPDDVPGRGARILLVDDDGGARVALGKLLSADGFVVSQASNGEDALADARRAFPDLVLTDLEMPRMGGVALCQRLHALDRALPVVVMTAHSDMESAIESLRAGAEDYLVKPLQYEAVLWRVRRTLASRASDRELAAQRAQLEALLLNLQEGVAIAEPSGRIVMANAAARAILGTGDDDRRTFAAIYALDADARSESDQRAAQSPMHRALRGDRFVDHEVDCTRPNGRRRRLATTGTSVKNPRDEVVLAIIVFRDITESRRHDRQREEYMALVSHDLLNPLSNIFMCASLLKEHMERRDLPEERAIAERAERNVQRMTTMLKELSEATRLEVHQVELPIWPCDLRMLVEGVVDAMGEGQTRRITVESDDTSPFLVLAEASQLERVVTNLLTNALKYSADDAPVVARMKRSGSSVQLVVVDRGIGIAPESLAMLFDRYYRAKGGKARATGLGLGLYIVRLIVELHGGRIDVASELGQGSTFTVTLPSAGSSS